MKKNEKRLILVLLIILAILVGIKLKSGKKVETVEPEIEEEEVVEEYVEVLEDGTRLNTSEELSKTKKVDTLEFTNIQLTNQNGQSVLLADVKNTGTASTDVMLVDIIILDKSGAQLGKVSGIVSPLNAGETTQFNTSMTIDYANAYDFQIVKK